MPKNPSAGKSGDMERRDCAGYGTEMKNADEGELEGVGVVGCGADCGGAAEEGTWECEQWIRARFVA